MTTTEKGLYPTEFWTVTAGDLAQKRNSKTRNDTRRCSQDRD